MKKLFVTRLIPVYMRDFHEVTNSILSLQSSQSQT